MVRRRILRTAIIVGILTTLAVLVLAFKDINVFGLDRGSDGPLGLTLGLDLQGGSYLKYQARRPDEVDVTFRQLPGDASLQPIDIEGALAGQTVVVQPGAQNNSFSIELEGVTEETLADTEADIRGELDTLAEDRGFTVAMESAAPLTEGTAGFIATFQPKEAFGRTEIERALQSIDDRASIRAFQENRYSIEFPQTKVDEAVEAEITAALSALAPLEDGVNVRPGVLPSDDDMTGVIDTINRRINALGTSEPTIQRLGDDKVIVQLPGVEDLEEAKATIGTTAQLVFLERTCENEQCVDFTEEPVGDGLTGDDLEDAYPRQGRCGSASRQPAF